jgi:hypothetical protein
MYLGLMNKRKLQRLGLEGVAERPVEPTHRKRAEIRLIGVKCQRQPGNRTWMCWRETMST